MDIKSEIVQNLSDNLDEHSQSQLERARDLDTEQSVDLKFQNFDNKQAKFHKDLEEKEK